jgi:hypothetical protein
MPKGLRFVREHGETPQRPAWHVWLHGFDAKDRFIAATRGPAHWWRSIGSFCSYKRRWCPRS